MPQSLLRLPLSLLLMLALAWCAGVSWATPAHAATDQEVEEAMVRMEKWLFEQQQADGAWEIGVDNKRNVGGPTAMAVYALLNRGNNFQDPRVEKGIKWLQGLGNNMPGTYARGVRSHVWSSLPDSYKPFLTADAQWLLQAHKNTLFDYTSPRKDRVDLSVTQYGQLGLWEAVKRGVPIPPAFWQESAQWLLKAQNNDGGWTYGKDGPSRGSMTCAGITLLAIAQQELPTIRNARRPPPEISGAINKGILWLDREWKDGVHPARGDKDLMYYLYGVERVALATGVKEFKGKDWFASGAQTILEEEKGKGFIDGHGGKIVNTAFALSFLARGRVPVWISKIAVPGQEWNNRPNDLYFATRYLSDRRESEIVWQVISIDDTPDRWTTPVVWLATDGPLELTEAQIAHLKGYLDGGGLLVFNPDGGSSAAEDWMQQLGKQMYPDLTWSTVAADHPLRNLVVEKGRDPASLMQLNNGVRDLILITGSDWGAEWQTTVNPTDAGAFGYATNLQVWTAGREALPSRLDTLPIKPKGETKGKVKVAMVKLPGQGGEGGAGPTVVEPGTYEPFRVAFANATGDDIEVVQVEPGEVAGSGADLVHLAGTSAVTLADDQLQAFAKYVQGGGTVLIENLGGRQEGTAGEDDFALSLEQQLAKAIPGAQPNRFAPNAPLITGQGLTGGFDTARVLWRAKNAPAMGSSENRLRQLEVDGRPAVVIASEDLSLGVMGNRLYGTNGYHPESARKIMTNILLQAKGAK